VHLAGGLGERGGQHDDVHIFHCAEQLGKAQVVTHRQPDAAERAVHHHHLLARFDGFGFVITLVAQLQIEQVNLVVARHLLALRIEYQATVQHLVRRTGRQGNGTAHQPYLVLARDFAEERLDRPMSGLFAHRNLVLLGHAHDGEKFRQYHQARALFGGFGDEAARLVQITHHVRAGGHLDGGHLECAGLRGTLLCGIFLRHELLSIHLGYFLLP
jgi:hypothetical protein